MVTTYMEQKFKILEYIIWATLQQMLEQYTNVFFFFYIFFLQWVALHLGK